LSSRTIALVAFYRIFRIHLRLDRLGQEIADIVRTIALAGLTKPNEPQPSF
jgi:hypothetical protein